MVFGVWKWGLSKHLRCILLEALTNGLTSDPISVSRGVKMRDKW